MKRDYRIGKLYRNKYDSDSIICIVKLDVDGFEFFYMDNPSAILFTFYINDKGLWKLVEGQVDCEQATEQQATTSSNRSRKII